MQFSFKNPTCFADYITKWKNGLQGRIGSASIRTGDIGCIVPGSPKAGHYELNLSNLQGTNIMSVSRRHFLKYCAGSATVLGLEFSNLGTLEKVLAAARRPRLPSYPISDVIYTTLDRTVVPQVPKPRILPRVRVRSSLCRVSSLDTLQTATVSGPSLRTPASIIRSPNWQREQASRLRAPILRWPQCF